MVLVALVLLVLEEVEVLLTLETLAGDLEQVGVFLVLRGLFCVLASCCGFYVR